MLTNEELIEMWSEAIVTAQARGTNDVIEYGRRVEEAVTGAVTTRLVVAFAKEEERMRAEAKEAIDLLVARSGGWVSCQQYSRLLAGVTADNRK